MMKVLLLTTAILLSVMAQEPPVWPARFMQGIIETWSTTAYKDDAKIWYDSIKGMSRIDRNNGKFDPICSSIQNLATPCVQIIRDGKRHVIFPLLRICCICCDSAHGCGILRRDWLKNAKYVGKDELNGQVFNRWRDSDANVDYWAHIDPKNTPRKIAEGSSNFKDLVKATYSETFSEIVFDLPAFCNSELECPATSQCGKFRG